MDSSLDFEASLARSWPPHQWRDLSIVVAVSGGPDSVALLRGLQRMAAPGHGRLIVGHFNHRWRGAESDADEQFVEALAAQLNLDCDIGRSSSEGTPGSEDAARRKRYQYLRELVKRSGARHLVTAHTADDQAETVLLRIVRGTGIRGLSGIPRVRQLTPESSIIRPLLAIRRHQVQDYLAELKQPFRIDSSNSSLDFRRNRMREKILPELVEHFNGNAAEAVCRLARLAGEVQQTVDRQVDSLYAETVEDGSHGSRITLNRLREVDDFLIRELLAEVWKRNAWPLQAMTARHWRRLADLLSNNSGQTENTVSPTVMELPGAIRAERAEDHLRFFKASRR